MKIGLLCCFYNCVDSMDEVIKPWLNIEDEWVEVAIVHGMFKEYIELGYKDDDKATVWKLNQEWQHHGLFDFLYIQNDYWVKQEEKIQYRTEAEIRNCGLQYLLEEEVDYVWLLDSDEFYNMEEIKNIINFIKQNQYATWFSINFKNYIFDGKQWIDGFCPARIFKRIDEKNKLFTFYHDNDVYYKDDEKILTDYKSLCSLEIPRNIAHVRHESWLNKNGKQKVEYHLKHFNGNCSYSWNEEKQSLEINEKYYQKFHKPIPIIYED